MDRNFRVYVAGHRGLAGSAITRALKGKGYRNLLLRAHAELELTDGAAVRAFFERERPEHVYLAAAKVGGIMANFELPADFVHLNLAIQDNVIEEARRAGVKRLLFLGSVCIYPRECPQPIKEEYLLTGPLEFTNRPYAIAKIAGIEMCWAYNRQYGTRYLAAMPNNLYGPGDNYDPRHSHVLPAFIRKFHEAKVGGMKTVTLWGSGTPRREMLHSDDMAEACVRLMELPDPEFDALLGMRLKDEGGRMKDDPADSPPARGGVARSAGVVGEAGVESRAASRETRPSALAADGWRLASSEAHPPLINIGWGEDYTIRELAERVRKVVGFHGEIAWDASKPDGTPRKLLDISRMKRLGWSPKIPLDAGIRGAYEDYLARFEK